MSIQVKRKHSGLPCAMGLRLIRALPGDPAFLSPSSAGLTADLTPTLGASGPHDFIVRKSRDVLAQLSSIATRTTFPDVRETPLLSARDGRNMAQIAIAEKQNIFSKGSGLRGQITGYFKDFVPYPPTGRTVGLTAAKLEARLRESPSELALALSGP